MVLEIKHVILPKPTFFTWISIRGWIVLDGCGTVPVKMGTVKFKLIHRKTFESYLAVQTIVNMKICVDTILLFVITVTGC